MEQRETAIAMEQRLLFYPSFSNPSEHEIEVAKIMLHLPDMIYQFESPLPISLPPAWGCQRKRSALAVKIDYASTLLRLVQLGQPSYYSSLLMRCPVANGSSLAKEAMPLPPPANAIKIETSSPDTPLSFDSSEYDDKPQQLLGKRKREDWYKNVEEFTKEKESLEIELQKVEHHCAKVNDLNLDVKAREEELMRVGHKRARLEIEPSSNNIPVMPLFRSTIITHQKHYYHHHQPIPLSCVMPSQHQLQHTMDQTAHNQRRDVYDNLGCPTSLVSCKDNNVGAPSGLNLCFKDAIVVNCSRPYDLTLVNDKVKAAEARQKRLEYCRAKRPRFRSR